MTAATRLLLKLFRFHCPQTAPQAVWWMAHFRITEGQTRYALRRLFHQGTIERQGARENFKGRLARVWSIKHGNLN